MKRHIVTYSRGSALSASAQEEMDRAEAWAAQNEGQILLCRRDGQSEGSLVARHGLHQALFCLRANLANVLWLPSWSVLGELGTRELVCAHVWAVGGEVVVGDRVIDYFEAVPQEQQGLREMARTSVRLLTIADPRAEVRDPSSQRALDIGEWDDDWERARLAHKLRMDFRLTLSETAHVLNSANFSSQAQRGHSGASVQKLLAEYHGDLMVRTRSSVQTPAVSAALGGVALVTFGEGAAALLPAATRYNASLSRPFPNVLQLPQWGDLDRDLRVLVLGFIAPVFGAVYVSDVSVFGTLMHREALFGHIWRYGGSVVVSGNPVDPEAEIATDHRVVRELARASARLFAILRAHDADTIVDEGPITVATLLARSKRELGWSYDEIADLLNRECFLTRRGTGAWHSASVRELLR
jgi:hypothetical protein